MVVMDLGLFNPNSLLINRIALAKSKEGPNRKEKE